MFLGFVIHWVFHMVGEGSVLCVLKKLTFCICLFARQEQVPNPRQEFRNVLFAKRREDSVEYKIECLTLIKLR